MIKVYRLYYSLWYAFSFKTAIASSTSSIFNCPKYHKNFIKKADIPFFVLKYSWRIYQRLEICVCGGILGTDNGNGFL